ncbi:MAG: ATP-binding protein [Lachnospiraceae bacterium]|nr:ATP-binding protein [Lachnospiraceae bacterium]
MYIKRHLEAQILESSKYYPVVMVCGQRQVGKSTMLNQLRESGRRYVTLDDMNARRLAEQDPGLFLETYGAPLLIDEFQRVPSLLLEMKRIVDQAALNGEEANGRYWLTGSQKFSMMREVSESLAGRVAVFDLSSLSVSEIEGRPARLFHPSLEALRERLVETSPPLQPAADRGSDAEIASQFRTAEDSKPKDIHQIFHQIFRGGMPKLVATNIDRERYYMDYVNTYLERDIKDLAQVGNLSTFYDFLVFIAARTSGELRYDEIANAIGVSAPTAKAWVSILERSGVVYILRPYYSNVTRRLVKTPKIYFMDTGLAAYLCRWPSAETLEYGAMDGAFFETWVVSEIVKSYYNAGKRPDLYYYRDTDKKELDLLIVEGDKLYSIEIKKSKAPAHPDKNFGVLDKFHLEVQPGIVLCMCDEILPYNRNTWLVPVSVL